MKKLVHTFFVSTLIGFLFLNAMQFLAWGGVQFFSESTVFFLSLGFFVVGVFFIVWIQETFGTPALIGLLTGAATMMVFIFLFTESVPEPKVISNISIKDAPQYMDYDIYHFTDGKTNVSIYGMYSYCSHFQGKKTCSSYTVVPVVTDDWTPADPITVWNVCPEGVVQTQGCSTLFSTEFRAGVNALLKRDTSGKPTHEYSNGIYNAQERFGVTSDPDAIVISYVPRPEEVLSFSRTFAKGALVFVNVLYVIIALLVERKKRKKFVGSAVA